jgi:hypothetical protein
VKRGHVFVWSVGSGFEFGWGSRGCIAIVGYLNLLVWHGHVVGACDWLDCLWLLGG